MKAHIHLAHAVATMLAYSSKLTKQHSKDAEIVAEVATILGAASETERIIQAGEVDPYEQVILHQAAIIKATVAAWTPMALPQLEQARLTLEWAAAQSPERAPLFVSQAKTEAEMFADALAAATGNLARAAGAVSAVVNAAREERQFKERFHVDRLLRIREAADTLTGEIKQLELPDLLSHTEL